MYESAFCEGKEMLNIEDIINDTPLYTKAEGFLKDMLSVEYGKNWHSNQLTNHPVNQL